MGLTLRSVLALLTLSAIPAATRAQGAEAPAEEAEAPAAAEAEPTERAAGPVGHYDGVTADADSMPASKVVKPGRQPGIYWLGFQAREGGGARLFAQLDRDVQPIQSIEDGRLLITLPGVVARRSNTVRALDTHFFDSTVARVEPRLGKLPKQPKSPRGLHLAIAFKDGSTPSEAGVSTTRGKDGLTYLWLDFAAAKTP